MTDNVDTEPLEPAVRSIRLCYLSRFDISATRSNTMAVNNWSILFPSLIVDFDSHRFPTSTIVILEYWSTGVHYLIVVGIWHMHICNRLPYSSLDAGP